MGSPEHRIVQWFARGQWWEASSFDRMPATVQVAPSSPPIETGGWVRAVRNVLGRMLKWLARSLYLSPLFIVAKVGIDRIDRTQGDLVTVAFVCMVVAFFSALNLYVLWSILYWVVRHRSDGQVKPPFTEDGGDTWGSFSGQTPPATVPPRNGRMPRIHTMVRIRGTIVPLDRPSAATPSGDRRRGLLVDHWAARERLAFRVVEARDFAVVADGLVPVVVRFDGAPIVVARPSARATSQHLAAIDAETRKILDAQRDDLANLEESDGWCVTLREGDLIEVWGQVQQILARSDRFELAGSQRSLTLVSPDAGSPYRSHGTVPALVLGARGGIPLRMRR